MGGGEVIDTGWHATYRLLALADDRPVEVTAMMDRFAVKQLTTEDTGVLLVRFASGAIGEIITSWAFSPVGGWHFEVGRRARQPGRRQDPAGAPAPWLAGAGRVHAIPG